MAESLIQNVGDEKRKIAIVGLMGLPGSGKSTLSNNIKSLLMQKKEEEDDDDNEETTNTHVIIVCYDEFVPLDLQKTLILKNNSNHVSITKILRKRFLKCVHYIGSSLLANNNTVTEIQFDDDDHDDDNNLSNSLILTKTKLLFLEKVNEILNETKKRTFKKCFIIVDDNNYYRSMRNEIFQIAKMLQCSFCILYLKTPLTKCLERNSSRHPETRVTTQIIEEMNKKLEEPNPVENTCDIYCIQIPCYDNVNHNNSEVNITNETKCINDDDDDNEEVNKIHQSIICLLECSLQNPIVYVDDTENRTFDRKICTENEIHQADLVLRKWINKEITLSSFHNSSKINKTPNYRKIKSQQLNTIKSTVLHKLKTGEFKIASSVHQDIEFTNEIISLTKDMQIS